MPWNQVNFQCCYIPVHLKSPAGDVIFLKLHFLLHPCSKKTAQKDVIFFPPGEITSPADKNSPAGM